MSTRVTRNIIATYPWPINLAKAIAEQIPEDANIKEKDVECAMEKRLNEAEQQVLLVIYRDGGRLQDAGDVLGFTRERARQLRELALEKLKRSPWCSEIMCCGYDAYLAQKAQRNKKAFMIAQNKGLPFTENDCGIVLETTVPIVQKIQKELHQQDIRTLGDLLAWKYVILPASSNYNTKKWDLYADSVIDEVKNRIERDRGHTLQQTMDCFGISARVCNALKCLWGYNPTVQDIAFAGARKVFYAPNIGVGGFYEVATLMAQMKLDRNHGYIWPSDKEMAGLDEKTFYHAVKETMEATGGSHVPVRLNVIRAGSSALCRVEPSAIRPGDTVFYHSNPRVVGSIYWGKDAYIISQNGNKYNVADLQ